MKSSIVGPTMLMQGRFNIFEDTCHEAPNVDRVAESGVECTASERTGTPICFDLETGVHGVPFIRYLTETM
jgi:hypothetical protein